MSNLFLKFVLLVCLIIFTSQKRDSFKNECGPHNGVEDVVKIQKLEDCIGDSQTPREDGLKCCLVEGEKDLVARSSCVLIKDDEKSRIELIEELSEIATKLRVDCGQPKKFKSECGKDKNAEPSSQEDCQNGSDSEKCCFIKIDSPQFKGSACRIFKDININTIGEAVVAAKTVGATLEVKCNWGGIYLSNRKIFRFLLLLGTLFLI